METYEFTFFSPVIAEKFADFCGTLGVPASLEKTLSPAGEDAVYSLSVPAQEESVLQALEACYDELFFGEQAAEIEGNDSQGALADVCGVQVCLSSGRYTTVAIEPAIMNKLLSVLSIDELQQFLAQVAEDIEFPKSGPICSRT
ncbi:MAG: hypothetical protein JXR44_08480 [Thiotrichales bacterium]|nr:hypothetical protein [Thiotrichales bacterium]